MTFNEAIYSIREGIRQFADDSSFSNRFILFELNANRAEYLLNQMNLQNLNAVPEDAKQLLCVELEEVPNSQCGCEHESCTILRSTKKIPQIIGDYNKISAGKYDSIPFDTVTWNRFIHAGNNKYNQNTVFGSLRYDDYIYVKSKNNLHKAIKCVYLVAIFNIPEDVENFTFEDGEPCFNKDVDSYPLDMAAFSKVKEMVIRKLLRTLQIPQDNDNNAREDVQGKTA